MDRYKAPRKKDETLKVILLVLQLERCLIRKKNTRQKEELRVNNNETGGKRSRCSVTPMKNRNT